MTSTSLTSSGCSIKRLNACILNNNYLGMVAQWQRLFYDERMSHTYLGTTPDFIKLGEAFGINSERITKVGETKEAVKRALKSGEHTLLEIIIDPDELLPMVPPGAGINNIVGEKSEDGD